MWTMDGGQSAVSIRPSVIANRPSLILTPSTGTYRSPPSTVCRLPSTFSVTCACWAKKPDRLLSISMKLVHFGVRSRICHYTFCRLYFVFIHIPGGSFIFDIFLVPRVRLGSGIAASVAAPMGGELRKSAIGNPKSPAGWNLPSF